MNTKTDRKKFARNVFFSTFFIDENKLKLGKNVVSDYNFLLPLFKNRFIFNNFFDSKSFP